MSTPEKVVEALLEMDDGVDPKEWLDQNSEEMLNKWEQIGGDFGDPWAYGGDWYNPFKHEILHIDGLEGEGVKEVDAYDLEATPEEKAKLLQDFPVLVDPEDPGGGDQNERDREIEEESILAARADKLNSEIQMTVYRFLDEDIGPDDWPKQDEIAAQYDEGVYANMPTSAKWLEVGRYHGFHELDHYPEKFTKAKLSEYLGLPL
jgi:hypothetical protein